MHLYDMKYGSHARRGAAEKSDRPEFQEAYKADVIQANAYLNKLSITKDRQKLIDYYRYFISSSAEAFAEVGATIPLAQAAFEFVRDQRKDFLDAWFARQAR